MQKPKVSIIVRTSKRPKAFKRCMQSIYSQEYQPAPNIIVVTDNAQTEDYVKHYPGITHVKARPVMPMPVPVNGNYYGRYAPYNEYINQVQKNIEGFILIIDDDDMYLSPHAVETIMQHAEEDKLLIWKTDFNRGRIVPGESFGKQIQVKDINTACMCYHSKHIKHTDWSQWKGADYRTALKLSKHIEIKWLDKILTRVQHTPGYGNQKDVEELEASSMANYLEYESYVNQNSEPVDVVYVLGTGSNWQNNEIRFSIRSLYKNLINFRNIYIIGEDPGFLKDVIIVPHPDEIGPHNADGNIIRKVLRACQIPELSQKFLFINDDHYIIKPVSASLIPPLHKGDLRCFSDKFFRLNPWRKRLMRTREILLSKNLNAYHFDLHTPILFDKTKFPKVVKKFDYQNDIGYTMKSLYGNSVYKNPVKNTWHKVKVFEQKSLNQIQTLTQSAFLMALNDAGLNNSLKYFLHQSFPEPSPHETQPIKDFIIEIAQWYNNGKDFQQGAHIFTTYFTQNNLKHLFASGKTTTLQKKLNYKLEQKLLTL